MSLHSRFNVAKISLQERGRADVDTSKKNVTCDFYNLHNGCPYSSWILMLTFMFNINSFYRKDVLKLHYRCFFYENNLKAKLKTYFRLC